MIRNFVSPRRTPRRLAVLACSPLLLLATTASASAPAREDRPTHAAGVVLAWNHALLDALVADNTPPPAAMRAAAIVAVSVFDAVDGLTHRYATYHLTTTAPSEALPPAAAAGAAHEALTALFPAQQANFDALLADTLAGLHDHDGDLDGVQRGVSWGVSVADTILTLRADDGFTTPPPAYQVSPDIGRWQPTPPAFAPTPAFRQFATMTPWALTSPDQFLPAPPPALTSHRYARDFNEVKNLGSVNSTTRTAFDTQTAQFWQSEAPVVLWDPVADTLIAEHHVGLTRAARVLALSNMAMADAVIGIWNAKNPYDTWRPVTAIVQAGLDNNPGTDPDPSWQPLLVTPPFQEYPAGHPGVSAAVAAVLAACFGNHTGYTITSPAMPGVTRALPSFSAGVQQVIDARVYGGIHFRFAGQAAAVMGDQVANWVRATELRPVHT